MKHNNFWKKLAIFSTVAIATVSFFKSNKTAPSKNEAKSDIVSVKKASKISKLTSVLNDLQGAFTDDPYNEMLEEMEDRSKNIRKKMAHKDAYINAKYGLTEDGHIKLKKKDKPRPLAVKKEKNEKEPEKEPDKKEEKTSRTHAVSYPINVEATDNNLLATKEELSKEITNDEIMNEALKNVTSDKTNLTNTKNDFENKKALDENTRILVDQNTGKAERIDIRDPNSAVYAMRYLSGSLTQVQPSKNEEKENVDKATLLAVAEKKKMSK